MEEWNVAWFSPHHPHRVNVLPDVDVVDWVEDLVVDGNVDGIGLSEAPFRIPLTHGNI